MAGAIRLVAGYDGGEEDEHVRTQGKVMLMDSAPSDVFKLVSLRSTDDRVAFDPTELVEARGPLEAVERVGTHWHRPDELGRFAGALTVLDNRQLKTATTTWVAAVRDLMAEVRADPISADGATHPEREDHPDTAPTDGVDDEQPADGLVPDDLGSGGPGAAASRSPSWTKVRALSEDPSVRDAVTRLVVSWLGLRLKARAGENVPRDLLAAHEDAIRVAAVMRRVADGTFTPVSAARLTRVRLVVPARWRNRSDTEGQRKRAQPAAEPAPPRSARVWPWSRRPRPERGSPGPVAGTPEDSPAVLRRERTTVVNDGRVLEQILTAATVLAASGEGADGKPVAFDESFRSALASAVPSQAQPVLSDLFRRLGRLGVAEDFTAGVESEWLAVRERANDLCQRIRVFEEESTQILPTPGTVTPGPRPSIRAAGWGDLFVVREELAGYRAAEISHIENAMAGESTHRRHERRHEVSETMETETLTETSSEDELQSTNRFELQAETARTISQDFSVEAGVNTSGRYGLTTVETSLGVGATRSSTESTQSATTIAQEVTAKAVDRTRQSVRELRRRTTVETIKEISTHALVNTDVQGNPPAQPRSGVYMWVEKVQRLQLYQYGKRLMIEFIIPEPGVSLLESAQPVAVDARKPLPLSFGPSQIDEYNYMCLTQLYRARNVDPPPPLFIRVGEAFATDVMADVQEAEGEATIAKMISLPEDYRPVAGRYATTGRGRTLKNIDPFHAHLAVAGQVVLDSAVALKDAGRPDKWGKQSLPRLVSVDPADGDRRAGRPGDGADLRSGRQHRHNERHVDLPARPEGIRPLAA